MRYNFVENEKENQFYPVTEKEIEEAEAILGLKFPFELKQFLLEVGFGFLKKSEYNINRLMDPVSIRDARLKENDFEFFPDIEVYEELEETKLIFFEANESALLLMELSEEENNTIYYDDIKIADSLEEFLKRLMESDLFEGLINDDEFYPVVKLSRNELREFLLHWKKEKENFMKSIGAAEEFQYVKMNSLSLEEISNRIEMYMHYYNEE